MVDTLGIQALGGLLAGVLALGGVCLFAARALLMGEWFSLRPIL